MTLSFKVKRSRYVNYFNIFDIPCLEIVRIDKDHVCMMFTTRDTKGHTQMCLTFIFIISSFLCVMLIILQNAPVRRFAGSPVRRFAGSPVRRFAGSPVRRSPPMTLGWRYCIDVSAYYVLLLGPTRRALCATG